MFYYRYFHKQRFDCFSAFVSALCLAKGQSVPQTVEDVEFTDFNNGDGGNYQLMPNSPYKNKGTDGMDLGADIVTINANLANVE